MKVGYFVETPVEHNLTGGSRSFLNLVQVLKDDGVEPFVVVSEPWALTEELDKLGIAYITQKMLRPFVGTNHKVRFYRVKYRIKQIVNAKALRRAVRWFRENDVELIHVNSQFAGIIGAQAAKKLHIPYVYHLREFLDRDFGVQFYSEKLVDNHIKPANRIIAISKSIREYYEQKFNRSLSLVYNGIPVDETTSCEVAERFTQEKIHAVIVGRVCAAKGQKEAVQAVELLVKEHGIKNLLLHIVGYMGKDAYELELKQYIEENGLQEHVQLHAFTKYPFAVSKDCDIGLMCSQAEAFGRVTVEYMLASLCTVGADTGGTPEIIEDGVSGLLYRQGSAEDLAQKLLCIIKNPQQANELMRKGRQRALDCFTISATAANIKRLYEEVLQER